MDGAGKWIIGGVALATGAWAVSYPVLLRHRCLTWGATPDEVARVLPGRRTARHCRHRLDARRDDRRSVGRSLALERLAAHAVLQPAVHGARQSRHGAQEAPPDQEASRTP